MVLPLIAVAYLSWHVWVLLPMAKIWKAFVILLGVGSFLLLFINFGRRFDGLPLPVAQAFYEIGTSSLFVMLYLVMLFLVLDLGRAPFMALSERMDGRCHPGGDGRHLPLRQYPL